MNQHEYVDNTFILTLPVTLPYARDPTSELTDIDRWCTEMFGRKGFYLSLAGARVETEEAATLLKLSFPNLFTGACIFRGTGIG